MITVFLLSNWSSCILVVLYSLFYNLNNGEVGVGVMSDVSSICIFSV